MDHHPPAESPLPETSSSPRYPAHAKPADTRYNIITGTLSHIAQLPTRSQYDLSLIHISEPTRPLYI